MREDVAYEKSFPIGWVSHMTTVSLSNINLRCVTSSLIGLDRSHGPETPMEEINPRLTKPPSKFIRDLARLELTDFSKWLIVRKFL